MTDDVFAVRLAPLNPAVVHLGGQLLAPALNASGDADTFQNRFEGGPDQRFVRFWRTERHRSGHAAPQDIPPMHISTTAAT